MYTKDTLLTDLIELGIQPTDTVFIHSSMKSIGEVKGGADTVLDALSGFLVTGLLAFPTHTWSYVDEENPIFQVNSSPSNVGILTEKFRKRKNVERSLHPTHSVAALGADAKDFTRGDEQFDTPTHRQSAYGKLLDRKAKILLVGVDLKRNTFIHGIEEWKNIPNRIKTSHELLITKLADGTEVQVPARRHLADFSLNYGKVEKLLAEQKAIKYGTFGDAKVLVCDTVLLTKYISQMLDLDPELFSDNKPLTPEFIKKFKQRIN